ncbi:hypothetical protein KBB96_18610 [Luteolibacter ambystomatis]|uniref:Uncharacterized protein n=1 Tax=Luteolibacter ambystomatis TaxID=2824561 RepID=A0A975G861_9BACT|nr:hypothetical protein [Luteolibacter ambystomatis]QUE50859.1 hypothetical protein KBB96_18610 [Luteolibacter ambystomatis]
MKFGDNLNLLDLYDEVVKPAFFDKTLKRIYDQTEYLLNGCALVLLDQQAPTVGIVGRLVKDTILEREQIFDGSKLVDADGTLESSPSSMFVLILNNHRLLYVKEHRGSPSMEVFRSTIAKFLKIKHRTFIEAKFKASEEDENGKRLTKKKLVEIYPYPEVDLTHVGSNESVRDFIHKFKTIESVTTKLVPTNSELDNDLMFDAVRDAQKRINSKKTTLRYENNEGLNKEETIDQISSLASQGNHEFSLAGESPSGGKMKGNNDDLKIQVPIEKPSRKNKRESKSLYQKFVALVESNIVQVGKQGRRTLNKISEISQNLLP